MAESVKIEKNAHIKTAGDAFVITAGFKFETVKNLIKYGKSSALEIINKETKESVFKVALGKASEVSRFGIVFTGKNKDGFAECTGCFPRPSMSEEEKKECLRSNFAYVIAHLNEVQKQIEDNDQELKGVMEVVDKSITID